MARLFRHPATGARTAIGADLYLTNKKRIPRQHGSYLGCRQRLKMLRIVVVLGNHRGVPSPALYAIAWAPYLHGCVAGMEHFLETVGTSKNAFTRSMRRIRPISGLREGISFQTTAAISCTCDCPSR